ncbi:hypothetical protein VIC_001193 [Vibrio coralliilyticus ATCC BAA-450]|nr:hypothetical protein VIC_001193 [Vibrio coralliilyticus ATCC BAA-450]
MQDLHWTILFVLAPGVTLFGDTLSLLFDLPCPLIQSIVLQWLRSFSNFAQ